MINNPNNPAIPEGANFEMSHGFAVVIEEMLNSIEKNKLKKFSKIAKFIDVFTDGLDLRWYHEFAAQNRVEEDSLFLTLSLPLQADSKN